MISAKSMDVRDNFKSWCGQVTNGEIIKISRPGNNYVYLLGQDTYDKLMSTNRIMTYMSHINGKDKITSLKRLSEIENLPDNWNNNGANKISNSIIKNVRILLLSLDFQPEIFPTANDAIQLEWENNLNEYLEMEILEDIINIFKIDSNGNEMQTSISVNKNDVKEIVKDFYDKSI